MTAKNTRRPKGDGSLFQRHDHESCPQLVDGERPDHKCKGTWVGRLTYEDRVTGLVKRTQVTGTTKRAAADALGKVKARVESKKPPRDDGAPFGTYAEAWIDSTLEASDRAPSTKNLYAMLIRTHMVGSVLGNTPFSKLVPSTVERFLGQLRKKGLADSTVRQIYTVARAVADSAVRDGLVGTNPFASITRPKIKDQERASFLTGEEVDRLLEVAEDSRFGVLFELLVNTGMRRGEALALRWRQDVHDKTHTLRIGGSLSRQGGKLVRSDTTKTKDSRRDFPITEDVADVLRRIKVRTATDRLRAGTKWIDSGFVFVTEFGEPVDPRNALRALKVAADRAGIDDAGLHTLRHTAAALMLNNGVPMHVVSKLLGHSSISITVDIYGHIPNDVTRDAADVLSAALRSARAIR